MAGARDREEREVRGKVDAKVWAKSQGDSAAYLKLPAGVEQWKLDKVGTFKVDFMPYIISGDNNPRGDDGYEHFEREYDGHRVPSGGEKKLVLCRQKCFREACAVCDFLRDNGGKADPELVKQLRATTRHLWVINDDPGNGKNPLKVFDSNHFNRGLGFGELMADAINAVDDYRNFADLKEGYTLQLTVKEQTFPGGKFNAVVRIDFLKRNYEYSEKTLKKAPCLDELLVDPGYETVEKMLKFGTTKKEEEKPKDDHKPKQEEATTKKRVADDDDEDAPKPKKEAAPPKKDEDPTAEELGLEIGDVVKHPEHGKCTIVHVSGDGTSLRLKDEDDDIHRGIQPNTVKKVKTEEKPAPKKKADDDDDDDDKPAPKKKPAEDDDDDDKPAPKKKSSKDVPLDDDDDD